MSHALLINPNTSTSVTDLLRARLAAALGPDHALHACTAPFGAPYIADEASYAVAAHATLAAYVRHLRSQGAPAAVLVGCFGDPGVPALRSLTDAPCLGLAEAALREAASRWTRIGIVTAGLAWGPMLRRFIRGLDLDAEVSVLDTLPQPVSELLRDPEAGSRVLAQAMHRAARSADGVVLGGAGLAALSVRVQALVDVPMLDSVDAGVSWLRAQLDRAAVGAPRADLSAVQGWLEPEPD